MKAFKVNMLDELLGSVFFLEIKAPTSEAARIVASMDWSNALFISVVEV